MCCNSPCWRRHSLFQLCSRWKLLCRLCSYSHSRLAIPLLLAFSPAVPLALELQRVAALTLALYRLERTHSCLRFHFLFRPCLQRSCRRQPLALALRPTTLLRCHSRERLRSHLRYLTQVLEMSLPFLPRLPTVAVLTLSPGSLPRWHSAPSRFFDTDLVEGQASRPHGSGSKMLPFSMPWLWSALTRVSFTWRRVGAWSKWHEVRWYLNPSNSTVAAEAL